ncbi:hypothetical protein PIB30_095627 [Stylosanthes scabra]|uniref:Uncharacterized protein n=1 Tax=Stylosanthes scabra TaxID=79078 RepID=A0ABU6UY54_9FABA|nr:hypothetical protein [Stylosanthes scabra]
MLQSRRDGEEEQSSNDPRSRIRREYEDKLSLISSSAQPSNPNLPPTLLLPGEPDAPSSTRTLHRSSEGDLSSFVVSSTTKAFVLAALPFVAVLSARATLLASVEVTVPPPIHPQP